MSKRIRLREKSRIEIGAAEGAFFRFFHPLFDAAPMVDVFAGESHDELIFFESLYADGTRFGAFLHDQRLDPVYLGEVHLSLGHTGQHCYL
jgi:hypothetical protein